MARVIATAVATIAVAACAPAPDFSRQPAHLSTSYTATGLSTPTIKDDSYSPYIQVESRGGERGQAALGKGSEFWGLFAHINKQTGTTVTYVQWGEVYWDRGWRFYSRASTNKGQQLPFDTMKRDVTKCSGGTCIYSEIYNIMMPASELRSGVTDGISFKIYSRNGDERIINIAAAIVEQFNAKVAEAQKMRKA